MAEDMAWIIEGPIDTEAQTVDAIVNGAVPQWAPVILVAPGSGEELPRVGTTTAVGREDIFGVKVGPVKTLVAGDVARICIHGRAKLAVTATAVARGDQLRTSATAGQAERFAHTAWAAAYLAANAEAITDELASAFAKALTASEGVAGDIIAAYINLPSFSGA